MVGGESLLKRSSSELDGFIGVIFMHEAQSVCRKNLRQTGEDGLSELILAGQVGMVEVWSCS